MANLASNPWSFTSSDPIIATITASPNGLILNADGTVTLSTTGNFGVNSGAYVTIIGATNAAYNGYYFVLVGSAGTSFTLVPQPGLSIPKGTAASGGGTVAQCLYNAQVRIEDISWQKIGALGDLLDIRDRMGNIIWQASGAGAGQQNRGKVFWVNGFTPITIASGVVIVTVN